MPMPIPVPEIVEHGAMRRLGARRAKALRALRDLLLQARLPVPAYFATAGRGGGWSSCSGSKCLRWTSRIGR
jgi:hypothetical protein